MARNLTEQVREIAAVVRSDSLLGELAELTNQTKSVARGDLTKTIEADVQGEILELKIIVNDMVSLHAPLRRAVLADQG